MEAKDQMRIMSMEALLLERKLGFNMRSTSRRCCGVVDRFSQLLSARLCTAQYQICVMVILIKALHTFMMDKGTSRRQDEREGVMTSRTCHMHGPTAT